MDKQDKSEPTEKTPTEAAGYITGTLTAAAQLVMPVRMWITLFASAAFLIFIFRTDSPLHIARALCLYVTLESILIGSGVFRRGQR